MQMSEIEKALNTITATMNTFKEEELGNRLSQFAWASFGDAINQQVERIRKELSNAERKD